MKVQLEAYYTIVASKVVELPEGKTWANVKDYYVKWGSLVLTFDDGTTVELDGGDADIDSIDFKRPLSYTVWAVNDDEEITDTDYEHPLAQQI